MSHFAAELMRLEARYAVALVSPSSCPRNREILRARIEDLRRGFGLEFGLELSTEVQINDAEIQRIRAALARPTDDDDDEFILLGLRTWQDEHIRRWEQGL